MAGPLSIEQSSQNPPAQPAYVLRGHSAQIHSVHFLRKNSQLLTGDADGWVVLWNTTTKRPDAVWKPHKTTILGVGNWGEDKVITHGRDNKLNIWQLRPEDATTLSKILPIDDSSTNNRPQPWLLHSLDVNALNFCSFASCLDLTSSSTLSSQNLLIAVPGLQDGHINLTSLPTEDRIATIPSPKESNTGMVMAIRLVFVPRVANSKPQLLILAGYEGGNVCVWSQPKSSSNTATPHFQLIYSQKSHAQPVLSLDMALSQGTFYTSSADAIIARHPLLPTSALSTKTVQTKHAGQQALTVRSDEKIFATAGWDGRMRVYSVKTMKELAVLKWHGEGCYAVSFAEIVDGSEIEGDGQTAQIEKEVVERRALTVAQKREEKARSTHWLAAGSKDGKVSLWEIY
ncbi:unnamed protein product [Zymoseptoria tritici ST99CH_3D1]|nr:unnamed protein product [Zymoseptoria tritici ST99CH_3D1]